MSRDMSTDMATNEERPLCKKELNFFQKFYYYRTSLQFTTNVYVGAQYNVLPLLTDLYAALAQLVAENPQLCLQAFTDKPSEVVEGKDFVPPESLYVAQLRKIDFTEVVEVHEDLDVFESCGMELLLSKKFAYGKDDKPLWKVFILKDNWLVFNYDHLFLDGISAPIFHENLITSLEKREFNVKLENDCVYYPKKAETFGQFDMTEIYEKPQVNVSFLAKKVLPTVAKPVVINALNAIVDRYSLRPALIGTLYRYSCGSKYLVKRHNFYENCLYINIPQSDILRLIKVAKDCEKISLNSLICSLLSIATKNALITKEQSLKFCVDANCRGIKNVAADKMGLIIKTMDVVSPLLKNNLLTETGDLNLTEFWSFSLAIHKDLVCQIPTTDGIDNINLLSLIDILSYLNDKEGQSPEFAFELSNLGLQFKDHAVTSQKSLDKKYAIKNAIFNQCIGITTCFTVSSIATPIGGMNLSIQYPQELSGEVENVIANFKAYVKLLVSLADI